MRQLRGAVELRTDANQLVQPWLERHPSMGDLIDDERIHQIPESLLGLRFLARRHRRATCGQAIYHGAEAIGMMKT